MRMQESSGYPVSGNQFTVQSGPISAVAVFAVACTYSKQCWLPGSHMVYTVSARAVENGIGRLVGVVALPILSSRYQYM